MSIISAIKTYLTTYASTAGLVSGALVSVDWLGPTPTQYSIVPVPGTKIVESYLDGSSLREFPFAFQAAFSTADEAERIENSGFYEAFADFFETETEAGILPTLTNKTATKIEALGWGYLFEQGQSDTGIYQIQCKLTYEQT
jgi:hypothetical protein